jgi:hypothetical protein
VQDSTALRAGVVCCEVGACVCVRVGVYKVSIPKYLLQLATITTNSVGLHNGGLFVMF